ncbi:pseudouridine synthase [Aliiroseovarius sp. KMU-50]|uniref:Pseudouridine synthase n=1 Tax=Aliiroseovarius salicola TaxID=3009082 RepID=A0ABT4VYQ0_9RHOB|nr:pseudouridine synthase [Aliiroseovarius sp. KMU-50]MDA5093374.1 pseudouridine synthase [Aliiroseovarius sp. KMU-50]
MSKETPKTPAGDRIAKVLARAGVASRREAERMIEAGRVSVNGKVITSPALNVTDKDRIIVDGKQLAEPEPARLWLYHKPTGLVTTAKDEKGRETVFDALPEDMPRVMSVGRLDLNSEGLLLLTNDGEIKRKLELPSTGWVRKYRVRVKGAPTDEMIAPIRKGITLEGERFQPMTVSIDRQQGSNAWLTVSLREGKNREIRRAMESVGLSVNRLLRVSYGPFQLGTLKAGEVEEVRRRVMRDQLGLDGEEEKRAPVRQRKGKAAKLSERTDRAKERADARSGRPAFKGKGSGGKGSGKPTGRPAGNSGGKPGGKPTGKPTGRRGPKR